MGKLGIEDVEEWLKLTDKDGVGMMKIVIVLFNSDFQGWNNQL